MLPLRFFAQSTSRLAQPGNRGSRTAVTTAIALSLLARGYKLRH